MPPFLLFLLAATAAAGVLGEPSPQLLPSPGTSNTTIHEILQRFALPPGLFPASVSSYAIDTDGGFVVDLAGDDPCYVHFDYLTYYEPRITGVLKYGSIGDLKGIQVKRFLIWLDVERIKVDLPPADYVYFDIGWVSRKLRRDRFEVIHLCGPKLASTIEKMKGVISRYWK